MHLNNDDMQLLLNNMEEGLERVSKVVHNMTIFAHIDASNKQFTDVNTCIKSAYKILQRQVAKNAKISLDLTTLPEVCINNDKIIQVFTNLIINASESMQQFGNISIHSRVNNGEVEVSIIDTGCGIPSTLHAQIFDPFYTTKKTGGSPGIGLAIAREIVTEHSGKLQVVSKKGVGTEFVVSLPIVNRTIH